MTFMMMKNKLNKKYWEDRYINHSTGWNIGYASTPLKTYIDQLEDKTIKILIPGAGNGYEAEYLWKNGFDNVYLVDIAKKPLENFKKRVADFPTKQLLNINIFDFNDQFGLIIEQTFFCALDPKLREKYANHMYNLLKPKGKIVGLLFNFELTLSGPPFGGSVLEYRSIFENKFKIKILESAINSIKERQGKELFFIFERLK